MPVILSTDVAVKEPLRRQIMEQMAEFERRKGVTVIPGCQMTPRQPHESSIRAETGPQITKTCQRPAGRKTRPQKAAAWQRREEFLALAISNNLNIREIDARASWGRSSSYTHGMLRGKFNPSPARIVEVERIITEMIEEKTHGKRSNTPA